jgi:hypothetical protein
MTLTKAMTRGDLVTYLAHPEWNAGVIRPSNRTARSSWTSKSTASRTATTSTRRN